MAAKHNIQPFIDGRIILSRLINEHSALTASAAHKANAKFEVNVSTASEFEVGVNDLDKPERLKVEIVFKAILETKAESDQIVNYEVRYACEFAIARWCGFSNWHKPSEAALAPYFAFTHHLARLRAEEALIRMGLRNISLPPFGYENAEPDV